MGPSLTWDVSTAVLRCSGAIGGQISTDMVEDNRVGVLSVIRVV